MAEAQKITEKIDSIRDKIWDALKLATDPESHNALLRIIENPRLYLDPKKCGEFLAHFELRLVAEGRKICVICPKNEQGEIEEIYFYLKSRWNAVFGEGGLKKVRLGCRVSLIDGTATVTADGKEHYPSFESENEREYLGRLKDIDGIVHLHLMHIGHSWKRAKSYQLYMMKYYSGGSLERAVIDDRLSIKQKFVILLQLFKTIRMVHERNVSHNDLKLKNILLDENQMPFVTDFGLSSDGDRTLDNVLGSAGIFPTEICPSVISRRFREIDRKVEKLFYERVQMSRELDQLSDELDEHPDSDDLKMVYGSTLEKFSEKEKMQKVLDLEHSRAFQNVVKFCAVSHEAGRRIVPKENDICALGFIVEDLFGREFLPELTDLIDDMSSPVISKRITLNEAIARLEKIIGLQNERQLA